MARRPPLAPWQHAALLAFEAPQAMWLRCVRLATGGPRARREAERMVREKVLTGADIALAMTVGDAASLQRVRRKVTANVRRLSGELWRPAL
ncbi:MAG TPA: hypothetical protein VFB16_02420 [Bauldia sp.]|nr:hypothetical protein [Bauldia sp.]